MAQAEQAERWRFSFLKRGRATPQRGRDPAEVCAAPASDEQLMARVGDDDTAALGELFERYHLSLFGFLLRLAGDRATAEDLAQEVFWRLWEQRARYDPKRPFATWLYTIARRMAWNELQRAGHRTARFSELSEADQQRFEAGEADADGRAPEEQVLAADRRSQVQAALQTLPPDQRLCLVLREYEGRSHREIGEIMGCSENNARVLTHRARRALRPLLASLWEGEEE
jgi:RNA polymerase sigma-70 factor (ECF subfamily)